MKIVGQILAGMVAFPCLGIIALVFFVKDASMTALGKGIDALGWLFDHSF